MSDCLKLIKTIIITACILGFTMRAEAYRVEISPVNPDQITYSMKLNEEVTFVAKAYTSEEKGTAEDAELPIEKIFWQFDYAYFQKTYSDNRAVRLRAVKEGKAILTVVGIVENYPFTKSVEIIIMK